MIRLKVAFLAKLQARNRLQVPVEIRWRFKLAPGEILHVSVSPTAGYRRQDFYARLQRGGRLTVPWEVVRDLELRPGEMIEAMIISTITREAPEAAT